MDSYKKFLQNIYDDTISENDIVIGVLSGKIVAFLKEQGIEPHTVEIHLTVRALRHMIRDSKRERGAALTLEEIENLPLIISNPDCVLFNSDDKKLNLLYVSKAVGQKYIKIVVDPRGYIKRQGAETIIKTTGKVERFNLKDRKYIEVEGKI